MGVFLAAVQVAACVAIFVVAGLYVVTLARLGRRVDALERDLARLALAAARREEKDKDMDRQTERLLSGIDNIMNYDMTVARKAASADVED